MTNCVKALSDPTEWPGVCMDTSRARATARASITCGCGSIKWARYTRDLAALQRRDVSRVFSKNAAHLDEGRVTEYKYFVTVHKWIFPLSGLT